ncbi:Inosine/uridine-preferring nucleoside hydrolase domain-containing protein [Crassisporium funariophilum]|nr:Inosine/uridine-preferring nucleoside hydrolase domain-containing protein [Crassisporium funariophilum]
MSLISRTPVIIDTDPGVDDVIAILLAITSPELEILGYSVSFGNTDLDSSYANILKIYQTIARHLHQFPSDEGRFPNLKYKPLLARGSAAPLEGEVHSAQYFHGRDGLGDIVDRHPELSLDGQQEANTYLQLSSQSGVDMALDILRSRPPRSVTYIALGPLTNLALMMRQDSKLVTERIGRIVCMGGALDVPGNTSPMAEFNFFADPYAVKELLISTHLHGGLPRDRFLMLPLDVTTPHELPFTVYKEVVDHAFQNTSRPSVQSSKPPVTHFTSSFFERTREIMLQFGKDAMELHDIVAVWCAIENPPFPDTETMTLAPGWHGTNRVFDIERTGELTRGMLVTDRREDESAYPLGANRSEAQRELEDVIQQTDTLGVTHDHKATFCITKTPGPAKLLQLLLSRVWGSSYPQCHP